MKGGFLHIYDMTTYKLEAEFESHESMITCLASSRDGCKLFSGSNDNTIKIWDTSAKDAAVWTSRKTLNGHLDGVRSVSESPCGKYLASGSEDQTVKLWDIALGIELRSIKAHKGGDVCGASFLEGGKIVSAGQNGKAKLWNLATRGREALLLKGNEDEVRSVAISADGKKLISGGKDKTVRVWDAENGELNMTLDGHKEDGDEWHDTACVTMSKDGKLAISCTTKIVRIWNLEEGKQVKKVEFEKDIVTVSLAPDEKSFFAGGEDGLLKQCSVETGESTKDFNGETAISLGCGACGCGAITSDGKRLVSGNWDWTIIVWDIESGDKVKTLEGHSEYVESVAITPDDKNVVSGSWDNTAKIWDIETGELLHTFEGHTRIVNSVAIHPSGEFIATGSKDKTWKLWSLISNKLLYTSHDAHTASVTSVVFSPDGNYLISGSSDTTIKIDNVSRLLLCLPSYVHDFFKEDCRLEDLSAQDYDWSESKTVSVILAFPQSLIEPRFDDGSEKNLVHVAAAAGRSSFLFSTLILKDDSLVLTKQKTAFLSLMARDKSGRTPLALAVEAGSDPSVKVVFECYVLLLSQTFVQPTFSNETSQELHLTELLPMNELNTAFEKFPTLALNFISQLSFLSSGDYLVQDGVKRVDLGHSSLLIIGSESRVPHGFWKKKLTKKGVNGKDYVPEEGNPVSAKFVPLPNIVSSDSKFLRSVMNAADGLKKFTVFENEIVKAVVAHKWKAYVRDLFLWHMKLDIAMVITLTIDALVYRSVVNSSNIAFKIAGHLPMIATTCLWGFFTRHETGQLLRASSFNAHVKDFWNSLDVISLFSIFAAYSLRALEWIFGAVGFLQGDGKTTFYWSTTLMAVALPVTYLNTLYYMQGFDESGGLVRMIIGIIQNVRYFVMILSVCMMGFAAGFFILFEGQDGHDGDMSYRSPAMSLLYSYEIMLAGFTLSDIDGSSNAVVTSILFIAFTLFINIVMLNLLIAIMGDIFDRIQENAKAEFIFARAQIILEFEAVLSKSDRANTAWFPTWLQVLVPTLENDEVDEGDWVGRVRALKNSVKYVKEQLEESEKMRKEERKENEKKRKEEREEDRVALEKRLEKNKEQVEGDKRELKMQFEESEKKREEDKKERKEETKRLEDMLKMICATWSPEEQRDRALEYESNQILKELGASEDDLKQKPTDAKSKNTAVKALQEETLEEIAMLEKKTRVLCENLDVSERDQECFKEELKAAGKLKRAGLSMLRVELDRLKIEQNQRWDTESDRLMEELGATVEELKPTPHDAESKNKALKELKKIREEENARMEEVVALLWEFRGVSEDDQKTFKEKLEAAGKLKPAGEVMLTEKKAELVGEKREKVTDIKAAVKLWFISRRSAWRILGPISDWDTSEVTDMSALFADKVTFNDDISRWDVSNVTSIDRMFTNNKKFNIDLGGWNVSKVLNMQSLFDGAKEFNRDLSKWDVSNVTNMGAAFCQAEKFNQNIASWNTSKVTNIEKMFMNATTFNQNISSWDTSKVITMESTFEGTETFNQDISSWDVSNVTNMRCAFSGAESFNQNLSSWDTSKVTNMEQTFYWAKRFNQDISTWDVANVTNMEGMFMGAKAFNEGYIKDWDAKRQVRCAKLRSDEASKHVYLLKETQVLILLVVKFALPALASFLTPQRPPSVHSLRSSQSSTCEEEVKKMWISLKVSEVVQKAFEKKLKAAGMLKEAGLALLKEERTRLQDLKLDIESDALLVELDVTVEELEPTPDDAESKNKALKELKKKILEEIPKIEKEVDALWKTLEIGEDVQKAFKEKLEATGKLKQTGLVTLVEERNRLSELLSLETDELVEELRVIEREFTLTDNESKYKALTTLKKKRTESLEGTVNSLWLTLGVGEEDRKAFREKLEAAGKAKLTVLEKERDRLWDVESDGLMEELGVTVEELKPSPYDTESKNKVVKTLKVKREKESTWLSEEVEGLWRALYFSEDDKKAFKEKLEATGKLKQTGLATLEEERNRLSELLSLEKDTMKERNRRSELLAKENNRLMKDLGVTEDDLDSKASDTRIKNKMLKELIEKREKEGATINEDIAGLWSSLKIVKDDQKAFNQKLEAAGLRKQASLEMMKVERDRLWDLESDKLMEELGATVEDLEPKPTDAESKNKALKALKKKREEESAKLDEEVDGLWQCLSVDEDAKKAFKEKLDAAGKLKKVGLSTLREERSRLLPLECDRLMKELGVTGEDLKPKPMDTESKYKALMALGTVKHSNTMHDYAEEIEAESDGSLGSWS